MLTKNVPSARVTESMETRCARIIMSGDIHVSSSSLFFLHMVSFAVDFVESIRSFMRTRVGMHAATTFRADGANRSVVWLGDKTESNS